MLLWVGAQRRQLHFQWQSNQEAYLKMQRTSQRENKEIGNMLGKYAGQTEYMFFFLPDTLHYLFSLSVKIIEIA